MGDDETAEQDAQEIAERSAEAMWADDRASQALGMAIDEVGPGRATLRMTVREDMVNGHDIGHGGLTFTLADSAFAFACNSYNRRTVAAGAEIRFRAPTRLGDVLVADARERSREGRDGVYDVTVTVGRDGGRDVRRPLEGDRRRVLGGLADVPGEIPTLDPPRARGAAARTPPRQPAPRVRPRAALPTGVHRRRA